MANQLDAILAKDDTAIMLDELRELFGADLDVDSRFTIAQILTAMEHSFEQGKEHIEMLHRAEVEVAKRRAAERIEALTKRIEELEEGLKPFAREADNWLDKMDCEDLPADATDIKISDLRRARSLLQGMDK